MRPSKLIPIFLGGLLFLGFHGCSSPESDPVTPPATPTSNTADDHTDHDHGDHADNDHGPHSTADVDSPMPEMTPGLKELSPDDHDSAMAQHVCPVTGEMLGTMGVPVQVDVNGRSVWICCRGCKDKLLADSDKYLAKLQN